MTEVYIQKSFLNNDTCKEEETWPLESFLTPHTCSSLVLGSLWDLATILSTLHHHNQMFIIHVTGHQIVSCKQDLFTHQLDPQSPEFTNLW